jgi:hypothetical protein
MFRHTSDSTIIHILGFHILIRFLEIFFLLETIYFIVDSTNKESS